MARRPRYPEVHRSSAVRDPEARVVLSERRFATSSAARACHTRCLPPAEPCTRACTLYLGIARAVTLHLLPRFRRFLAFRSRCFSSRPSSHFGKCVFCCCCPCSSICCGGWWPAGKLALILDRNLLTARSILVTEDFTSERSVLARSNPSSGIHPLVFLIQGNCPSHFQQ